MPTRSILEVLALPAHEGEPAYRRLAQRIRECIESGQLEPGDVLPTKRELAGALHVSVATVRHAYDVLARDTYLIAGRGLRTRVAGPPSQPSASEGRLSGNAPVGPNELRGRVRSIESTATGVRLVLDLVDPQELRISTSRTVVGWLGLAPGCLATVSIDSSAILLTPFSGEDMAASASE
jgi:DNA-binding transcriptional regulator YhcF (GntR family)